MDPQVLTEQVTALADGNFLYAKVLLGDIEAGQQSLDDLAALPQSLDEIYHGFLRRFDNADWDNQYQPILGKLVVAQEPITESQLANFTGIRRRQVRRSLAVVGQYLDVGRDEQDNKIYRLFHQSLRSYLLDENRSGLFCCDPREEHELIAGFYVENHQDDWSDCDQYGRRYLRVHLAAAGQVETLRKLLFDFDWLQAKLEATDSASLIADLDLLPHDRQLRLLRTALRRGIQVLARDSTQLAGQLIGQLLDTASVVVWLYACGCCYSAGWQARDHNRL